MASSMISYYHEIYRKYSNNIYSSKDFKRQILQILFLCYAFQAKIKEYLVYLYQNENVYVSLEFRNISENFIYLILFLYLSLFLSLFHSSLLISRITLFSFHLSVSFLLLSLILSLFLSQFFAYFLSRLFSLPSLFLCSILSLTISVSVSLTFYFHLTPFNSFSLSHYPFQSFV